MKHVAAIAILFLTACASATRVEPHDVQDAGSVEDAGTPIVSPADQAVLSTDSGIEDSAVPATDPPATSSADSGLVDSGAPECDGREVRCVGLIPQSCQSGHWTAGHACQR